MEESQGDVVQEEETEAQRRPGEGPQRNLAVLAQHFRDTIKTSRADSCYILNTPKFYFSGGMPLTYKHKHHSKHRSNITRSVKTFYCDRRLTAAAGIIYTGSL